MFSPSDAQLLSLSADFLNKRPDAPKEERTHAGEPDGASLAHHEDPRAK